MKIHKTIPAYFTIVLCSLSSLFAQLDISKGLISDDQRFVKQAIDSALVIVRQDYVLKSTTGLDTTEWGRGGNSWFGRGYTLGIITGNLVWANRRVCSPWYDDLNFKKYEMVDTLAPLLSRSSVRSIYNTKYFEAERCQLDSVLATYKWHESTPGLKIGLSHGEQQGWIVLAYTSKPFIENDTTSIEMAVFRSNVFFNDTTREAIITKLPEKENIIGGIFITTQITTGNIQLLISGILTKKPLNWCIQAIEPSNIPVLEPVIQLTPIPANIDQMND